MAIAKIASKLTKQPDVDLNDRLMMFHNTDAEKLARQEEQGGFAMPSLAITKGTFPFDNFGDITLIAKPEKFDPKESKLNQIFSADAYTVLSPTPIRKLKKGGYKIYENDLKKRLEASGEYVDDISNHIEQMGSLKSLHTGMYEDVVNKLQDSRSNKIFLDDIGVKYKNRKENITDTALRFRDGKDGKLSRAEWVNNELNKLFDEQEFFIKNQDRDYVTQSAKLAPYTAEEITKYMKKKSGRNVETKFNNPYGLVGAYTRTFNSLREVIKNKKILDSEDVFADHIREVHEIMEDLGEISKNYYKGEPSQFVRGHHDNFMNFLDLSNKIGVERASKQIGYEFPEDFLQQIDEFRNLLKDGPTEYFEVKPKRVVNFDEFGGALIPRNTDQATRDLLTRNKIPYEEYLDEFDKVAKRDRFKENQFGKMSPELAGILSPLTMAGLVGYSIFKSDDADAIPIAKAGKIIIEAYHGTPHKVDKFSTEKIGTGEGAQAYGHGLYFADRKGVAQSYQEGLSANHIAFDGQPVDLIYTNDIRQRWSDVYDELLDDDALSEWKLNYLDSVAENGGNYDKASDELDNFIEDFFRFQNSPDDAYKLDEFKSEVDLNELYNFTEKHDDLDVILSNLSQVYKMSDLNNVTDYFTASQTKLYNELVLPKLEGVENQGNLYKVEIEASPDEFLDWDKPLKNQPKKIQDAVIERYKREKRHDLASKLYKDRKFGKVKLNEKANKLLDEYDSSYDTKTILELTDADEKILGINVNKTYQEQIDALLEKSGQSAYYRSSGSAREQRIASENLLAEGIKGIRFLDGASRTKPLKQFIQEFRKELPDDADIEEVMEMVHQGHFNKEQTELLRALEQDDFLGYDRPLYAVDAAFSGHFGLNYDPSQRLLDAIEACKPKDATNNYVVFDDSLINIKTENDVSITPVGELTKVN